jgi:hypothetical protein
MMNLKNQFGSTIKMNTCKRLTRAFKPLALCLVILCGFGCNNPSRNTLVDSLKAGKARHIIAIEQIDVITRDGLPSDQDVRGAKVLKRVEQPAQIEAFGNALSTASYGRRAANHPGTIGEVVLRVETTNETWFIFGRVEKTAETTFCVVNAGEEGETNVNRMNVYESDFLPAWLKENQIEPR